MQMVRNISLVHVLLLKRKIRESFVLHELMFWKDDLALKAGLLLRDFCRQVRI